MNYPARYKFELLNALEHIDLEKICQVIDIFSAARAHGRRIFVCGERGTDLLASQSLCEMVNCAGFNRSTRFRILALSDHLSRVSAAKQESAHDRVFVEQLKNFAKPDDVVMGISVSGKAPLVVRAVEYASWIGCHTIAVTGSDAEKLTSLADVTIEVRGSHAASIEDVQSIICHMIGCYFAEVENS